jgi:hypothetical protein
MNPLSSNRARLTGAKTAAPPPPPPSKVREAHVAASGSGFGFTVRLPNGHELEAEAADASERDEWVAAVRLVLKTSEAKPMKGKETRESVAFANISAEEKTVVEAHKRRVIRGTRFLF